MRKEREAASREPLRVREARRARPRRRGRRALSVEPCNTAAREACWEVQRTHWGVNPRAQIGLARSETVEEDRLRCEGAAQPLGRRNGAPPGADFESGAASVHKFKYITL